MREVPTTSGRPSATSSPSRRSSSRLCAAVLPKPIPGSSRMRSSAIPSPDGERQPLLEERLDLRDDVVVARSGAASCAARRACASGSSRRRAAATSAAISGSARNARHVVDERRARVERGRGDGRLGGVDRDLRARRRREPATTGSTRAISSAAADRLGARAASTRRRRRGCPRPARSARSPWATAASASRKRPPSENESGVTLTTPISV